MSKKIRKILVIITTFNPNDKNYKKSFEDFSHVWFDTIRGWQKQREGNLKIDIIIADNISGQKTRKALINFKKKTKDKNLYLDFIDEQFTSSAQTFNHATFLFENKKYDYYIYCASDAVLCNKKDLKILLDELDEDKNSSIISPQADHDMAQKIDFNKNKSPTRIKFGQGINAHIYIFNKDFMKFYSYKWIDILGSARTESFYTYLCAAINKHLLLSHKVCIHHIGRNDVITSRPLLNPFYKRDFFKMLKQGQKLGLGFEECLKNSKLYKNLFLNSPCLGSFKVLIIKIIVLNPLFKVFFDFFKKIIPEKLINFIEEYQGKPYIHKHNPNCFDKKGYARSKELYKFIKQNLFLAKKELDYSKISYKLIK